MSKIIKFLHVSDIHLGISRYNEPKRSDDFFVALYDVFTKYAVGQECDFVLVGGDLFDTKTPSSIAFDQAITCFSLLASHKIPAIVGEGNHDAANVLNGFSWLRTLSKIGYIKLLAPEYNDGNFTLYPWNEETKTGGYIDILDKIRIYGTTWYGSSTKEAIEKLIPEINKIHNPNLFNIMLLHTEVEGQLNKPIPGLKPDDLRKLKCQIDYLALGHIHKSFIIDDWAYNPGSIEAPSVEEYFYNKGAFLVEITGKSHSAKLVTDYKKRKIVRIKIDLTGVDLVKFKNLVFKKCEELEKGVLLEIVFTGKTTLKASELCLNDLNSEIKDKYNLFLVLLKNNSIPPESEKLIKNGSQNDRKGLEKVVLSNLISDYPRYKDDPDKFANLILDVKKMANSKQNAEDIANFIEKNF